KFARNSPRQALHLRSSGSENLPFKFRQAVLTELENRALDTIPILWRDKIRPFTTSSTIAGGIDSDWQSDLGDDIMDDCSNCSTALTTGILDRAAEDGLSIRARDLLDFADWAFGPD